MPGPWCDASLVDSEIRWVNLVALESVAREPCSKRKFQSHPTVPPGRLIGYRRLTYDISRYPGSYKISYTICNSWVLGQAACFITRRARRTKLQLTVRCCIKMHRRTRFSTTCSAISSTKFQKMHRTGLPLPQTSQSTWAPHIQRFRALLLSQRPTF